MSTHPSKSHHSSTVDLTPKAARLVGGADPLPAAFAPTPPADPQILPRQMARPGLRPLKAQLDVAPEAARELRGSQSFTSVIGSRFAEPGDLADAIEFAYGWYREAKASQAWSAYTKEQSALAWSGLLTTLEKIQAPLLVAQGSDSALGKELHAFTRLVTARSDAARRGHGKRAKAKPSDAATAAPEPAVTPAPAVAHVSVNGASAPPTSTS